MTDLDELERRRAVYDRATKCRSLIGAERLSLILDARAMYETALFAAAEELIRDARRYREVRRGQHWNVINGIGDTLRAETLDAAVDAIAQEGKG